METRQQLFEAATDMGEELTKWKLRDWRTRRGLLPNHIYREGHGKGGSGSTTYYPDGTAAQLKWLIYFKRRSRSLDVVGWKLWGIGFPVVDFVQEHLPEFFREGANALLEEIQAYEEGRLDSIIYSASTIRLSRVEDEMRRRVPEGQFQRIVRYVLELFSGNVSESLLKRSPRLIELLEMALPYDPDWGEEELEEVTPLMAELFNLDANIQAAEEATDREFLKYQREALWGWRHLMAEVGIDRPCPMRPLVYALWFAVRARDTRVGRIVEERRQSRRWQAIVRLLEMRAEDD